MLDTIKTVKISGTSIVFFRFEAKDGVMRKFEYSCFRCLLCFIGYFLDFLTLVAHLHLQEHDTRPIYPLLRD